MSNTYMFTGFPGYLATALMEDLFQNGLSIEKIYLIHLPQTEKQAKAQVEIWNEGPLVDTKKIELIHGDITKPDLGIPSSVSQKLQQEVTHLYHLAALYDLAVPLSPAWEVNVQGTRQVNRWVSHCLNLDRYIYFSTAYVSGKRKGSVYETDLIHEEGFKNHYEYTKYEAELLVDRMQHKVPTTIIRPGIVVGHTKSGMTAKFDGPYFLLNMLEVMKHSPILPFFGKGQAKVNLVPQDYVIAATNYLAHQPESAGQTYHLTDPNPYEARDIYEHLCHVYANKHPRFTVPLTLARQPLRIRALRKGLGIQKQALDYFLSGADYVVTQSQTALMKPNIYCPDLFFYIDNLVDYYREKREDPNKHISLF